MKISKIHARQILDSRGNPTIEAEVILEDGSLGRASVPSGASTGTHEALELRDGDPKIYQGRGVLKAVENVNSQIAKLLDGYIVTEQEKIDQAMIDLDGTPNKSKLGANAILSVSLAVSKAAAISQKKPLFKYYNELLAINFEPLLPLPMMNIINGGQHANFSTDIQEFMIMPIGAKNFSDALRMGSEVFHTLGKVLKEKGYLTTVGDEGGYAPQVKNGNGEAMDLILEAIKQAGYSAPDDFVLALDVASSELLKNGHYQLKTEGVEMDSGKMINFLSELTKKYPVLSIEDGLDQEDWEGWKRMNQELGEKIQLVGDDLLVTNVEFLQRAIDEKACNAILIKPNQIGSLTETIKAVELAHRAGFKAIISNRSGETEDTTIAHLAVGLGVGQIKTGSLSRTDRIAKYNELLRIEEMLGDKAEFAGKSALQMKGIRHG